MTIVMNFEVTFGKFEVVETVLLETQYMNK